MSAVVIDLPVQQDTSGVIASSMTRRDHRCNLGPTLHLALF
ncbi:hypothetical protein V7x_51710 [Crateriforma conspicua]|uniref:Uncharacterized protein n=1 Tax=Crateriforma conspicua TaxID=2527996 RepID=A0A5C6FTB0_9PLAN|nr:hypothetical protein V7x_51710 [Crateriforma conspicua]